MKSECRRSAIRKCKNAAVFDSENWWAHVSRVYPSPSAVTLARTRAPFAVSQSSGIGHLRTPGQFLSAFVMYPGISACHFFWMSES